MWSWRREALKSFYRQGEEKGTRGLFYPDSSGANEGCGFHGGQSSAAVGGIATVSLLAGGLYPTLKAAGAEPIETLRYE